MSSELLSGLEASPAAGFQLRATRIRGALEGPGPRPTGNVMAAAREAAGLADHTPGDQGT